MGARGELEVPELWVGGGAMIRKKRHVGFRRGRWCLDVDGWCSCDVKVFVVFFLVLVYLWFSFDVKVGVVAVWHMVWLRRGCGVVKETAIRHFP